METKVIKLKFPIQQGSEQITEIHFARPPLAKDMRNLPSDPEKHTIGHMMELAAVLSGNHPSVIDKLDPEDLGAVLGALGELRRVGQGTGDKPSAP